MFRSKTTDEMIEQEAANLKSTLTQLERDVREVMIACTHPDAVTRQLSHSALKRLKDLEGKLEDSIEGKEEVLKRRQLSRGLLKPLLKLFTRAKKDVGMSAEEADRKEKKIMAKYRLESEEAGRNYVEYVPEDMRRSPGNYPPQNFQQQSSSSVTHHLQVPASLPHLPGNNEPAVIPSQQSRTSATTTRKHKFEPGKAIQKGKSTADLRGGHRSNSHLFPFNNRDAAGSSPQLPSGAYSTMGPSNEYRSQAHSGSYPRSLYQSAYQQGMKTCNPMEEPMEIGQKIVPQEIFDNWHPDEIRAFIEGRSQTRVTKASIAPTNQAQMRTSNRPSDASTNQSHERTKPHHASSGRSKQSSHQKSFDMPIARDMPRRREEIVPNSSQRHYSYSSTASSLRPPSLALQGSVNSLEYQEGGYGGQYEPEDDSSSEYDTGEIEESMERMSIASRDTFGQPKHGKHKYGGAGNTQGSRSSKPY